MPISVLLDQGEHWQARQDGHLVLIRVDEMTAAHAGNLRAWLLRNAPAIQQAELMSLYSMGTLIQGEMALDDLDCEMDRVGEQSPEQWMRDQVLFQALGQRLNVAQAANRGE
jgi:hypothetical protein